LSYRRTPECETHLHGDSIPEKWNEKRNALRLNTPAAYHRIYKNARTRKDE